MGRFAAFGLPVFDAIALTIAERTDFDVETVEDLLEACGLDDLYADYAGPMIDQIQARIGLVSDDAMAKAMRDEKPRTVLSAEDRQKLANAGNAIPTPLRGGVSALPAGQQMKCTCPHCHKKFVTTLDKIVNHESDQCPHCGSKILPDEREPPIEGVEP